MSDKPLPGPLQRLIVLRPLLKGRIEAMYRGCRKGGRGTEQSAVDWVLRTLRKDAQKTISQGITPKPRRFKSRSQYAIGQRSFETTQSAYSNALSTIGAIDRTLLESTQ